MKKEPDNPQPKQRKQLADKPRDQLKLKDFIPDDFPQELKAAIAPRAGDIPATGPGALDLISTKINENPGGQTLTATWQLARLSAEWLEADDAKETADRKVDAEVVQRVDAATGKNNKSRIRNAFIREIGAREIQSDGLAKITPTIVGRVQRRLQYLASVRTDFRFTDNSIAQLLKGLKQGPRGKE